MASATPFRVLLGTEDVSKLIDDGLSFTAVDPGGFETCAFSFPRRVRVARGLPIRIEAGLATAWQGRAAENGRKLAGGTGTQIVGEGSGAVLKDNDVAEIYIDTDLGRWQGPSLARKISVAATYSTIDPSVVSDQATPSLLTGVQGAWSAAPGLPLAEAWYDALGVPLGELYYSWTRGANVNQADVNWVWKVVLSSDDVHSSTDPSANLRAAGPGSGTLAATTAGRYWATAQLYYTAGPAGADNIDYPIYWPALAVYGRHGLTKRAGAGSGFWASDIAWDAVSRAGGIDRGVIEQATGLVVPQAAWPTPVAHEAIPAEMGRLMGWHWGTWESQSLLGGRPRFDFRSYPASATCWTSRARCADLDLRERIGDLYDRARVSWTDTGGRSHTTLRTLPSSELAEAVPAGRTVPIDMGVSTLAAAQTFGDFVLALSQRKARAAGSVTLTGQVDTPNGPRPACLLRPGLDCLRVTDLPDLPFLGARYDFQIQRTETTAGRDGVQTTAELGTGADLIEVLQARLALSTERAAR